MAVPIETHIRELFSEDIYARRSAARIFCYPANASAAGVPVLLKALEDPDPYIRVRIVEALGAAGDPAAIPHLEKIAKSEDEGLRTAAIGSLARLGNKQAVVMLLQILQGQRLGVSWEAARFLEYTNDPSLVPDLLDILERVHGYTRARVIITLGKLGDSSVIPWLIEQLASEEYYGEPGMSYFRQPEISELAGYILSNMIPEGRTVVENWQEIVLSSVYYPKEIAPGLWLDLYLYLYRAKAANDVAADIAEKKKTDYREHAKPLSEEITEGTLIHIQPNVEGIEFNPPGVSIRFQEDWHQIPFKLRATGSGVDRSFNGMVTLSVEGVIVADIPISIYVAEKPPQPQLYQKSISQFYRSIFCSYSHKDKQIVERVESAIKSLGIKYLRDVTTLRSGELWDERLLEMIEEADIFQLFWSASAAASQYVEKEWRHALELQRAGFIRPVCWVEPIQPAPPPELQHLHFAYVAELAEPGQPRQEKG